MEEYIENITENLKESVTIEITFTESENNLDDGEKLFFLVNQWPLNRLTSLGKTLQSIESRNDLEEFLNADFWEDEEDSQALIMVEVDEETERFANMIIEAAGLTMQEVLEALLEEIVAKGKVPAFTMNRHS